MEIQTALLGMVLITPEDIVLSEVINVTLGGKDDSLGFLKIQNHFKESIATVFCLFHLWKSKAGKRSQKILAVCVSI